MLFFVKLFILFVIVKGNYFINFIIKLICMLLIAVKFL